MAATSVVVLDRGNNTTCTINLHGKCLKLKLSEQNYTEKKKQIQKNEKKRYEKGIATEWQCYPKPGAKTKRCEIPT